MLARPDQLVAYPIVFEVPVLLTPEAMGSEQRQPDLEDPRWAEAYKEMAFYNASAGESEPPPMLVERLSANRRADPTPFIGWLDAPYDAAAQYEAYKYLGDPAGKYVAQVGGKGVHAVKWLLADALEAWLVTPMYSEAIFALQLAEMLGVGDRLKVVVAIGEELPFEDQVFDTIYAGGCLHHMETAYAGPEIRRVLKDAGRFAAVEPWATVLHFLGTRTLGKREANPYCRPLDNERIKPVIAAFRSAVVNHHGPLLRYLALGVTSITGRELTMSQALRLGRIDDSLPLPGRIGGSVAVLASR